MKKIDFVTYATVCFLFAKIPKIAIIQNSLHRTQYYNETPWTNNVLFRYLQLQL